MSAVRNAKMMMLGSRLHSNMMCLGAFGFDVQRVLNRIGLAGSGGRGNGPALRARGGEGGFKGRRGPQGAGTGGDEAVRRVWSLPCDEGGLFLVFEKVPGESLLPVGTVA